MSRMEPSKRMSITGPKILSDPSKILSNQFEYFFAYFNFAIVIFLQFAYKHCFLYVDHFFWKLSAVIRFLSMFLK